MIALAVVENHRIFAVKGAINWHLPYSHLDLESRESDEESARRIFSGYFPDVKSSIEFYGSFMKGSPYSMSRIYVVKSQKDGEILRRATQYGRWLEEPVCPNISPLTINVMRALKHDKLMDWRDRYVSTHNHPRKIEEPESGLVRPTLKQIKEVKDRIPLEDRVE